MDKESQLKLSIEGISLSGEQSQCTNPPHHWKIETPAGEMSLGTCKNCGESRFFRNYSYDKYGDMRRFNRQAREKLLSQQEQSIINEFGGFEEEG